MLPLKAILKTLSCVLLCTVLFIAPVPALRQGVGAQSTLLIVDPPSVEVAAGSTVTVDLAVRDVADLYGVALEVHFDPALVEVVGTAITPGSCPSPDFVVQNSVDNVGGVIRYDASSLSPSAPCTGDGVIASVILRGLSTGLSPIEYADWLLSDTDGIVLPVSVQHGSVEVGGPAARLGTDPIETTINVSETTTVDIVVTDPGELYGVELVLTFDPAVVEVVDDDPGTAGVQITPGTCPIPNFVVENAADNGAGTVRYGATSFSPSLPCTSGGVVASITFHGLSDGQSALAFAKAHGLQRWAHAVVGNGDLPALEFTLGDDFQFQFLCDHHQPVVIGGVFLAGDGAHASLERHVEARDLAVIGQLGPGDVQGNGHGNEDCQQQDGNALKGIVDDSVMCHNMS